MQVYMDLDTLKKFVISYHNDYNYDMTEDWEYDWTFPKAFLFTVTIMTTIGKHMQSFGWINHQSIKWKTLLIILDQAKIKRHNAHLTPVSSEGFSDSDHCNFGARYYFS